MATATILSDENLTKFKNNKENLKDAIKALKTDLATAEDTINGDADGIAFRANTSKGREYYNNLKTIIDTLQGLSKDLNNLTSACDAYYTRVSKK